MLNLSIVYCGYKCFFTFDFQWYQMTLLPVIPQGSCITVWFECGAGVMRNKPNYKKVNYVKFSFIKNEDNPPQSHIPRNLI